MSLHSRVLTSGLSYRRWFTLKNNFHNLQHITWPTGRLHRPTGNQGTRQLWICVKPLASVQQCKDVNRPSPTVGIPSTSIGPSTLLSPCSSSVGVSLYRGKKSKRKQNTRKADELSDDDEDYDDEEWELNSGVDYKEIRARVPSLRLDAVLKAGLNLSRNKIENHFYSSKIRVNEEKILKKSKLLEEGDQIDVIKGHDSDNPDLITVARVVILKVGSYNEDSDKITIKLCRYPNMLIKKYDDYTPNED